MPEACRNVLATGLTSKAPSDLPVVNVSFCSAALFCAAQSKRLCGALGGAGVVLDNADASLTTPVLEWEVACANRAETAYFPWGTTDSSGASSANCLVASSDPVPTAPRPVGASPRCGPSPDGPLDMIGNVWEYVNVRDDRVADAYTAVRGGSYAGGPLYGGCATSHGLASGSRGQFAASPGPDVGFRCCASLPQR